MSRWARRNRGKYNLAGRFIGYGDVMWNRLPTSIRFWVAGLRWRGGQPVSRAETKGGESDG